MFGKLFFDRTSGLSKEEKVIINVFRKNFTTSSVYGLVKELDDIELLSCEEGSFSKKEFWKNFDKLEKRKLFKIIGGGHTGAGCFFVCLTSFGRDMLKL